jgi:hypothetical protein
MVGIGGCRSSGVLGASAIISPDSAKLIGLHLSIKVVGGNAVTVKAFDGTDNSGLELCRFYSATTGTYNLEYDMHGVMCPNGIFLEITEGGTSEAFVSVEYN